MHDADYGQNTSGPDVQHAASVLESISAQRQEDGPQQAWQEYNSVFTAAKAGMQGVDKEKVKKIVYDMSKDSAHFKNEQRKQAHTDGKIAQLKKRAAALNAAELAAHQKACDVKLVQLEAGRDLTRTWLHVDMDAFYASVEELDQPELKRRPMAVGGLGMITTANYEARRYGVRSAMPGFIAKKLCPQLVFVKPNFEKYSTASKATRAIFRNYDPNFAAASLDEAYLDVTDYCRQHAMAGEQVATQLRKRMQAETRLTCSVGVAPNMLLAKVGSDIKKPNGQFVVEATRDAVMAFMQDLPVRKVSGIGKVAEQTLNALGITTCSQLHSQRGLLAALVSTISSDFFLRVSLGLGQTRHSSRRNENSSEPRRKGISCERTFAAIQDQAALDQMADSLVQHLASDMSGENIEAKTLTLKLKTTTFEVRTRAVTLASYVSTPAQMLPPILKLLQAELPIEIRLMGVRGSNLRKICNGSPGTKMNALQRLLQQGHQHQQSVGTAAGDPDSDSEAVQFTDGHDEQLQHEADQLSRDILDTYEVPEGNERCNTCHDADSFGAASAAEAMRPAAGQILQDGQHSGVVPALQQLLAVQHLQTTNEWRQQSVWRRLTQSLPAQSGQVAMPSPCMHLLHNQQLLRSQQLAAQCQQHAGAQQQQPHLAGSKRLRQPDEGPSPSAVASVGQAVGAVHSHPAIFGLDAPQPLACQPLQQEANHLQLPHVPQLCHLQQQQQPHQQQQPSQQQEQHWLVDQQQHMQSPQYKPAGKTAEHVQTPKFIHPWKEAPIPSRKALSGQHQQEQYSNAKAMLPGPCEQPTDTSLVDHDRPTVLSPSNNSKVRAPKATWTCLACTYSGNKQVLLRCEVCDTAKGSSNAPEDSWLCRASISSSMQQAQQGTQQGQQSQGRSSGNRPSSGRVLAAGPKQLKLKRAIQSQHGNC